MSQYYNEDKLNEDRSKKLIVACSNAQRDVVEKLIEANPNIRETINDKNNMGETALHVTAIGGDHYIVQTLLDNGADPKISDKQGRTPLMRAALLGNLDAVQVFVAHDETNVFDAGSTGQTPLHCACLISNMELINQFIELDSEGRALKMRDNEGNTPFLECAQPPVLNEPFEFLLEAGADVNEENNNGENALLFAARNGATKTITFLLEKGITYKATKKGNTPLHEVALRKNLAGVKIFLDGVAGVDLRQKNEDGDTPLSSACAGGDPEIVKLLISKNADVNDNCMHAAAKFNRPPIVRLLSTHKADIDKKNEKGETPLILAVEENLPDMCQLLLEAGAKWDIKYENPELSKKPIDAIQWSKLRNHKECTKVLEHAKKHGCVIC